MSRARLTAAQLEALAKISEVPQSSRWANGLNVGRALERRGLATVTSSKTYLRPGHYLTTHTVTITDAGRAALAKAAS